MLGWWLGLATMDTEDEPPLSSSLSSSCSCFPLLSHLLPISPPSLPPHHPSSPPPPSFLPLQTEAQEQLQKPISYSCHVNPSLDTNKQQQERNKGRGLHHHNSHPTTNFPFSALDLSYRGEHRYKSPRLRPLGMSVHLPIYNPSLSAS